MRQVEMPEGRVVEKARQENKKEILAVVDQILGRSQFFYDWEKYNTHDKIIITEK